MRVAAKQGFHRTVGGRSGAGVPAPRALAAQLAAHGRTVLVADPAARGPSAALSCFGALAVAVAEVDSGSSFVAQFSEQLRFDERLALLEAAVAELPADAELLLERPAAWGASRESRQTRRRCRAIFDAVAASPVDLILHEGSTDGDAQTRAQLEGLAGELAPARMAELCHPARSLEALASTVLSVLDANPRAAVARRVLAAGAWASDWHPPVWTDELDDPSDPVARTARSLFECYGELHRLTPAVRSAMSGAAAERWITDGVRRRLLAHARERLDRLQREDHPGAPRALVEAARMAAELGDVTALAEVGVLSSELLDAAAVALRVQRRARALDVAADATRADPQDGDALRHHARMLDAEGVELDTAVTLYEAAVGADRGDVDAHEGLVSLWLARADEARARTALHLARLDLEQAGVTPGPEELLIPVAATALRRARTGFARDALALVPEERRSSSWCDHWQYLLGLEAAESGRDYVPLRRLGPAWWREGPELLARREPQGPLRQWVAGLVTGLDEDDDELLIEGALVRDEHDQEPVPTSIVLGRAAYDDAERDGLPFGDLVDRYVELGSYGDDSDNPTLVLRVHRRQHSSAPTPKLDPRRVLRPQRLT